MTEREPTEEMIMAGINAANRSMPYINDTQMVLAIWKAMQARATPALPQAEHDLEDVRCQCCGYMTYHSEHMGCIRSAYKQALPQVPEGMAIVPVDAIPAALPMEPFQTIDMGSKNYKAGWNACRSAMLAAAKEKQS